MHYEGGPLTSIIAAVSTIPTLSRKCIFWL